jgi:DNA-binding SARP family transcriptional activator
MRFGILGPFEVADDEGRELALGGRKQRSVLAILLLRAGDVVPSDRLIDELWGERPPPTAAKTVQVYVSNLRKALGEGVLVTRAGGYALRATAVELDARQFEALADEGQGSLRAGDPRRAATLLRQALGLWRGPALADFAYDRFAQAELARLEESRLLVLEDRIDAELGLGEHARLVGELEALVREHPLRERPVGQLMLALYRSGRQADALELYRRASERLRDELGLEPSPRLRELERSILNQDATVEPPARAAPLANLPTPATAFVGRRHELAELEALLRSRGTRLLTLTGAGGSGKTRLALRVAETSAAEYRDGTWFVGFADISDPELIVPTINQTLGLAETARLEPLAQLQQWLGERQVLLVLDNLEQLTAGSTVLAALLGACPSLTLLVTSREPLNLAGEQQYEVPVLEPEDAVALVH